METVQHPYPALPFHTGLKKTVVNRFISWCRGQEKNRLGWLAIIITLHGCVITPLTIFLVILAGNNFIFWPWLIAAITMTFVTNLAALSTQVTIPLFFLSILIDVVIIGNCICIGLN